MAVEEKLLMDIFIDPEVIPHYVSYAVLSSATLICVALVVKSSMKLVPKGVQNLIETIAEIILKLAEETIGHHYGKTFFPLIGTIFIYILLNNLMGLIPGFTAPTANLNTNAAIAIPVFLIYQFYGLKVHGIKYMNHYLGPIRSLSALPLMIMMFFIELIGHFVRPVTLSVRLFGNMTAKHVLLFVLGLMVPAIIPVLILSLGLLVSLIQAYVFTLLSTAYIAGAVEEAH
ncbi:MAG: F0F1 ATP synthase subunit A [Nitrospirota bacterium]